MKTYRQVGAGVVVTVVFGLGGVGFGGVAAAAEADAPAQTCGPETGMQGQVPASDQSSGRAARGYCRNVQLLSTAPVEDGTERGNVARLEDCVYSGTPDDPGLAVVDISDPTAPRTVTTFPGVAHTWDTLSIDAGRRILVAKTEIPGSGEMGMFTSAGFTVFSIGKQCTDLRRRGTFDFQSIKEISPFGVRGSTLLPHEFQLSPDGRAVAMSLSVPDAGVGAEGTPSLVIADVTDVDAPKLLTTYDVSAALREEGIAAAGLGTHDFDFNADGTRLYAGLFTGQQQDASDNAAWRGTVILDIEHLREGRIDLVAALPKVGGHTARWGRVGKREVLVTNTEFDCLNGVPVYAPAGLQIVDITNEKSPRVLANPTLEANATPQNCLATARDRTRIWAHFGNFDDREDAALYFTSWTSSGVRVFDLRNPAKPVEVGYINPADGASAYSYPLYDRKRRELVWGGPGVGVAIARVDRDILRKGQGRALRRPASARSWRRLSASRQTGTPQVQALCVLGGDAATLGSVAIR